MNEFILPALPPKFDFDTVPILKQLSQSNKALAELKGFADQIPNKEILINSLTLQEAKDSSEIENIITTQDELFEALAIDSSHISNNIKEVLNYRKALRFGFEQLQKRQIITTNDIVAIQKELSENDAGIRKQVGTVLKNLKTGEVIYTPPQDEETIRNLLANLEKCINEPNVFDPLIMMAILHYQFESIHPFYDGNGRTGRILNILYLCNQGLLDSPILYLSGYIIKHKSDRLLQEVRTKETWEEWTLYILKGIEQTAIQTLQKAKAIKNLVDETALEVKEKLPKIYKKELIDAIFTEVYTKTAYVEAALDVERHAAAKYLKELEKIGVLESFKKSRTVLYINPKLYNLLKGDIW
ncbi:MULTISPECIES: Fic family protein [unclassified Sulfurospirillum]|uniref:Fic family protein n=1 Tax=unclassified Sulfurospirillum TaxID=2618290 RepID=UPI000502BAA9|nr:MULTISPECIES: Fic family protein [unclassified Sulfurospirillum]KFL33197.1 addiction module protein [Sulfurospirillum sp. SCADC]